MRRPSFLPVSGCVPQGVRSTTILSSSTTYHWGRKIQSEFHALRRRLLSYSECKFCSTWIVLFMNCGYACIVKSCYVYILLALRHSCFIFLIMAAKWPICAKLLRCLVASLWLAIPLWTFQLGMGFSAVSWTPWECPSMARGNWTSRIIEALMQLRPWNRYHWQNKSKSLLA